VLCRTVYRGLSIKPSIEPSVELCIELCITLSNATAAEHRSLASRYREVNASILRQPSLPRASALLIYSPVVLKFAPVRYPGFNSRERFRNIADPTAGLLAVSTAAHPPKPVRLKQNLDWPTRPALQRRYPPEHRTHTWRYCQQIRQGACRAWALFANWRPAILPSCAARRFSPTHHTDTLPDFIR